jgi:23S rRNA (guanine2445-N2)-methyltransferase / 23S rRNA (guanine2069-N7)-methyltransferase
LQHDAFLWRDLVTDAHERREKGVKALPAIMGSDVDAEAVALARDNVARANFEDVVRVEQKSVKQVRSDGEIGLVIANPPYGERVGSQDGVRRLYGQIGVMLRDHFSGWWAAIFTGRPELGAAIRLKPRRSYDFYNGTIDCKLMVYKLKAVADQRQKREEV